MVVISFTGTGADLINRKNGIIRNNLAVEDYTEKERNSVYFFPKSSYLILYVSFAGKNRRRYHVQSNENIPISIGY
jgi:hypothetical protein